MPSLWRECSCACTQEANQGSVCHESLWGIFLTSLVSKVMCKILESRLLSMAEEKGLIVEEQGGFQKK